MQLAAGIPCHLAICRYGCVHSDLVQYSWQKAMLRLHYLVEGGAKKMTMSGVSQSIVVNVCARMLSQTNCKVTAMTPS